MASLGKSGRFRRTFWIPCQPTLEAPYKTSKEVKYFEYRAHGPPQPDSGEVGDIHIDFASNDAYGKLVTGWALWPGIGPDVEPLRHPIPSLGRDRVLFVSANYRNIAWYTPAHLVTYRRKHPDNTVDAKELVSLVLQEQVEPKVAQHRQNENESGENLFRDAKRFKLDTETTKPPLPPPTPLSPRKPKPSEAPSTHPNFGPPVYTHAVPSLQQNSQQMQTPTLQELPPLPPGFDSQSFMQPYISYHQSFLHNAELARRGISPEGNALFQNSSCITPALQYVDQTPPSSISPEGNALSPNSSYLTPALQYVDQTPSSSISTHHDKTVIVPPASLPESSVASQPDHSPVSNADSPPTLSIATECQDSLIVPDLQRYSEETDDTDSDISLSIITTQADLSLDKDVARKCEHERSPGPSSSADSSYKILPGSPPALAPDNLCNEPCKALPINVASFNSLDDSTERIATQVDSGSPLGAAEQPFIATSSQLSPLESPVAVEEKRSPFSNKVFPILTSLQLELAFHNSRDGNLLCRLCYGHAPSERRSYSSSSSESDLSEHCHQRHREIVERLLARSEGELEALRAKMLASFLKAKSNLDE